MHYLVSLRLSNHLEPTDDSKTLESITDTWSRLPKIQWFVTHCSAHNSQSSNL